MKYSRITFFVLGCAISFFSGCLLSFRLMSEKADIQQMGEINPLMSLVNFERIDSGYLLGRVEGKRARLRAGDEVAVAEEDGSFRLSLSKLGIIDCNITPETIPEHAKFVASKSGSKVYPLDSKQGERIRPDNRVYFETIGEAIQAGYKP